MLSLLASDASLALAPRHEVPEGLQLVKLVRSAAQGDRVPRDLLELVR